MTPPDTAEANGAPAAADAGGEQAAAAAADGEQVRPYGARGAPFRSGPDVRCSLPLPSCRADARAACRATTLAGGCRGAVRGPLDGRWRRGWKDQLRQARGAGGEGREWESASEGQGAVCATWEGRHADTRSRVARSYVHAIPIAPLPHVPSPLSGPCVRAVPCPLQFGCSKITDELVARCVPSGRALVGVIV